MNTVIATLEKERKRALIPFWIFVFLALVSLAVLSANPPVGLCILLVSVVIYAAMYSVFHKRYVQRYNDLAVRAALLNEFEGLVYKPTEHIDSRLVSSLGCMEQYDSLSGSGLFLCEVNGASLASSRLRLVRTQKNSNGKDDSLILFSGRWLTADYQKSFKYDLIVRRKGFEGVRREGNLFCSDLPMVKCRTNNDIFNINFAVYAADPRHAEVMLTPQIIDDILSLNEQTKGKVMLCFRGHTLHIAVSDRDDTAEPPLFRRITSLSDALPGGVKSAAAFAETLRLEKKIWNSGGI